ncbi:hypothetical protein MWU60_17340 [Yoonia sp. F2084L]|uniref:hypothetical protein n=1 Tax=Yoonia sp. F2084L TaxID=2926419 RepID=UPI001FF4B0A5|nr:hypothetical protein [Yoonia sp. F2084L]MCK0097346.1 hypothetical protein [Yoonia sp. F2084L]
MKTIEITTHLDATPDEIWEEVNKPRLLFFVARPLIRFKPVKPRNLPNSWHEEDYLFAMFWYGFLPLGRQTISISRSTKGQDARVLRDNGHSALIKRWDHLILVQADGNGTRYTDRVEVEAGILTPLVAAFARGFYAHRQRRLRILVDSCFDYAQN